METIRIRLSLITTYIVFAILLNSVGTVIMQSINSFGVTESAAGILEGFKDLSIAIVSFVVASFLPRFGYRRSMIAGLLLVTLACLAMPLANSFFATKMMFMAVGVAFALVKVSVYSSIGLITKNPRDHAGFMNVLEGMFMVGVLAGYWIFGYFIGDGSSGGSDWLDVYWVLAVLCLFNIVLLLSTKMDESGSHGDKSSMVQDFRKMMALLALPMVLVFVISAFLYVLIEQGIGTWLPNFNNKVLNLPSDMSVQATSIFAASLAIGRLSAGAVLSRVSWYPVLNVCVLAMAGLVLLTLPLTRGLEGQVVSGWAEAPLAAFLFPLIGLFMAPIYPAINSVILSALPTARHSSMTGLIVIFSALGGTTGSLITGRVFEAFDGQTAFYLSLVPMLAILMCLYLFRQTTGRHKAGEAQAA
ncbi:MFS transporter [Iodidimonas nitroreducens]|uniref:MFS transporter n=1 Tax=Iodidimonas nitroreducens TaxID=1236968 RepID=A0A5A7N5T4_9PROT|nr:MFS transporter [Iodidimonas nitroreducens]GAK32299.1 putative transporter [alpha proteobacterium Q-1]GER03367.1 MFS transporter [Iodidimonas nitroreducens]